MDAAPEAPRLTAMLGPTNTGKTYLAIERMLDHASGMIGFPLRLLARENYDRVVRIKGVGQVALVTGEEKIIPPRARYFICTVESMPLDRAVEFLAIDEIQLCADNERGHVFTDRLLRARGEVETMFLGADTIRPIIQSLVPGVEFVNRPRFSRLTYNGPRKLTRIPPRSAVVAFSASDVYAIAEYIRHQRGGAAVVLGALSPRTRSAQVAMYQAGEVDYLVATDAIGMGLNMDVGHVAFARTRKFDGRHYRMLAAHEVGQIAGRAGRHMNDGTFGTTSDLGPFDPEIIEAVENHRFPRLKSVWWRNSDLEFSTPRALLASLEMPATAPQLMRAREAEDQLALAQLIRDEEITDIATAPAAVQLLWDVCRIPDFRKTMTEAHTRFLARLYLYLMGPDGCLPADWVAGQLAQLDRTDGDIDTLMMRIAHTRTWTYISHRVEWLADPGHWQERARAIEDGLSDALHTSLTQRFVDRRAAPLSRLRGKETLLAAVAEDGGVAVEGVFIGRLEGLNFMPDAEPGDHDRHALISAAKRALQGEIIRRVDRLVEEPDEAFTLGDDARIDWRGVALARLSAGADALSPRIGLLHTEFLTADLRARTEARLVRWFEDHREAALGALIALRVAELAGAARGLAFQLVEALGVLPRGGAMAQLSVLGAGDRKALRAAGVRLGLLSVFLPAVIKPRAARLKGLLWSVHRGTAPIAPPAPGRVTVEAASDVPRPFYEAVGYRIVAGRAIRVDVLDRFAIQLMRLARKGPFAPSPDLLSLLGLNGEQIAPVIAALGYRRTSDGEGYVTAPRGHRLRRAEARPGGGRPKVAATARKKAQGKGKPARPKQSTGRKSPQAVDPDSPFAKLKELRLS